MKGNGNGYHGNGHEGNGHDPAKGSGVGGSASDPGSIVGDLGDPHRSRASLRMIQRAVRNGWNIKDEWLEAIPKEALRIMLKSPDERNRLRAAELLASLTRDATSAAVALDKIERLDAGEDTERVTVRRLELEFDRSG